MKRFFVSILVLLPLAASGDEMPTDPSQFDRIGGDWRTSFDVSHYCHMDAVYAVLLQPSRERKIVSSTIVWDMENNRPYRCEEFEQRQEELEVKYKKDLESYHKRNSNDRLRPKPHNGP